MSDRTDSTPASTTGSVTAVHDDLDDFVLCDKSGVCLASMHLDGCRSQMSFAQLRAEEQDVD